MKKRSGSHDRSRRRQRQPATPKRQPAGNGRNAAAPGKGREPRRPGRRTDALRRLGRFLVIGVVNTLFGYGVYALLVYLKLSYLLALLLSTVAGVIFNFFSTGRLVFRQRGGLGTFASFIAAYALVYLVNAAELDLLVERLRVGPYAGQAICLPTSVAMSWILLNFWVFKSNRHDSGQ